MSECPLCKSSSLDLVDRFSVRDLLRIAPEKYRSVLRENLSGVAAFEVIQCNQCHLLHFSPAVPGSEQFYRLLSEESFYYMEDKPEYELVRQFLPKATRLLEVGCGSGLFARKLSGQIERYHGLEYNPEAIRSAGQHGITVTAQTIEAFAQDHSEEFNAVGSFQVLEHVAEVHSFIEASLACLEPGGVFFFAVPNQDSFVGRAANQMLSLPPHHLTRWPRRTVEAIADIFALNAIAVVEEELADHHLAFYVQTCYRLGLPKNDPHRSPYISKRTNGDSLVKKVFEKFILGPILNSVVTGMRSSPPRCKGHTIVGVFQKPQP